MTTKHDAENHIRTMATNVFALPRVEVRKANLRVVSRLHDGTLVPKAVDEPTPARFLVIKEFGHPDSDWGGKPMSAVGSFRGWKWLVQVHVDGKNICVPFTQGAGHEQPPTFADVLSCLVGDGRGTDSQTFEDWASDFGLDTDSRKAEKTFQACRDTRVNLAKLLGVDELAVLEGLDEDDFMARFKDAPTYRTSFGVADKATFVRYFGVVAA